MDNNNVALITKMVLEAVENRNLPKRTGISGSGTGYLQDTFI